VSSTTVFFVKLTTEGAKNQNKNHPKQARPFLVETCWEVLLPVAMLLGLKWKYSFTFIRLCSLALLQSFLL